MQNRYAGDVGDFIKLGLLRHIASVCDSVGPGRTVGLNWYLAPDEVHNADGKHIAYLLATNRQHAALERCDPDLFRRLRKLVLGERSVRALNDCGALPAGSPTYSEVLEAGWDSRERAQWHLRALDTLRNTQVIFVDPDNGVSSRTSRPKIHKYALMSELADYARRHQSIVAYHHADRSASVPTQALLRLKELAAGVDQAPVGTVIARRGSCRLFLVTAAPQREARLSAALKDFAERWVPHVELVLP